MTIKIKKVNNKVQEKVNTLAKLFNAESGIVQQTSCRGKYRGCWDYSVILNNGTEIFISMGFSTFEEILDDKINKYQSFNRNRSNVIEKFREVEKQDNEKAVFLGLNPYKLLDINYCKTGDSVGWFYAEIEVNNKTFKVMETNFCCQVQKIALNNQENFSPRTNYYVAGGLKDNEADHVFMGVGMSSESPMYKVKEKLTFYKMAIAV